MTTTATGHTRTAPRRSTMLSQVGPAMEPAITTLPSGRQSEAPMIACKRGEGLDGQTPLVHRRKDSPHGRPASRDSPLSLPTLLEGGPAGGPPSLVQRSAGRR